MTIEHTATRGNPCTRPALSHMSTSVFVDDDTHVQVVADGKNERRSLHLGIYDSGPTLTLYIGDAALELIRDAIDEHLEAVRQHAAAVAVPAATAAAAAAAT